MGCCFSNTENEDTGYQDMEKMEEMEMSVRQRLENRIGMNDGVVTMDGDLHTKQTKTRHYRLTGTHLSNDDKKSPLSDQVVSASDWDEEISGIRIELQSGMVLLCVAPNMVEFGNWRRALECAVNPHGQEAKALKKELRKAKKKEQQQQEQEAKQQQQQHEQRAQQEQELRAKEEQTILDAEDEAEKLRKAKKATEARRRQTQERNRKKSGLRKRNKLKPPSAQMA